MKNRLYCQISRSEQEEVRESDRKGQTLLVKRNRVVKIKILGEEKGGEGE